MSEHIKESIGPVLYEQHGDIGLILLNDHVHRNALCALIVSATLDALKLSQQNKAKAVIISSAQSVFCAGADIKEMRDSGWLTAVAGQKNSNTPLDLFQALESDGRPMIAAVNGLALGGGFELALACDLVVAADSAFFSLPEIGLGVIPNTAIARLPSTIGTRRALETIWTRARIPSQRAYEIGLVNHIFPLDQLRQQAIALAESIVQSAPPTAIAAVKKGIKKGADWEQIRLLLTMMDEHEWQEGFTAFLQKRKPAYDAFWRKQ